MIKMPLKSKLSRGFSGGGGSAAGQSWKKHAFFLLSVLAYIVIFLSMGQGNNYGMGIVAVIPVIAAAWVYGTAAGCAAGLLSLAANIGMYHILGVDWYVRMLKKGALLEGTIFLMLIGCVIGRISELSRRLKKELAAKELAEQELQLNRQNLETQVAGRTSELSAALQQLMASNQELVAREQALLAHEERLRSVVDTALDAILTTDSAGTIIGWNTSAERIYGYSAAEAIGRSLNMVLPERSRALDSQGLRDAVEQLRDIVFFSRIEGTGLRKDGTEFPTEVSQSIWKSGNEVFATGIVRDITERKIAEAALLEREERLRAIVENALDAIITTDSQGVIVSWNRAAERIFGYTETEILGREARMLVPERVSNELESQRDTFWRQGIQASNEITGIRKDGTEFSVEVTRALWSAGAAQFATAVVRDITERKNAERDRMLLSTVIEQANENIIIMDARGVILYANPALGRLVEQPVSEMLGINVFQSGDSLYDQEFISSVFEQLQNGKAWTGVLNYKIKGGKIASLEQFLSPVLGADGRLTNILSISRDVTREQNLEEQLRQSQKMEAIGTLAGGIAHDFNNILAAILGYTELAAMDVPAESVAAERLRLVVSSCDRARSLVKQILTFSRKNPQAPSPVRIADSIRETVRLLRASLPSTIEISQDLQDPEAVVMADPTQIQQLFLNLCTNAAQAMEETGGTLSISLDRHTSDGDGMLCFYGLAPGAYVRLTVRDTGVGISREIKERIFEPFFTTKAVGKGTGMGLAVAHGIVKSYGGCIYADSDPGKGAAFHVLLPVIHEAPQEFFREHPLGMQRGAETILLVDDEEAVAQTCGGMLTALGYTIVSTASSMEALDLFSSQPERFDCVITDMTMPYMRGDVLARKLMALRPGLPVILCTGFSEKISEQQALEQGIKAFLMKPYTMQGLAAVVRTVLDAAAQH